LLPEVPAGVLNQRCVVGVFAVHTHPLCEQKLNSVVSAPLGLISKIVPLPVDAPKPEAGSDGGITVTKWIG
jgi:hypothetical protein